MPILCEASTLLTLVHVSEIIIMLIREFVGSIPGSIKFDKLFLRIKLKKT